MYTSRQDQSEIGQVIEDNILALLDTIGVKDADDIEDDKMSFIEAVYALCIAAVESKAPTWRVHKSIFEILDGNHSMVLNFASYLLLVEINQKYPQITVREASGHSSQDVTKEIFVNSKIWSPFSVKSGIQGKSNTGITTRNTDPMAGEFEVFIALLNAIYTEIGKRPDDCTEGKSLRGIDHKSMGLMLKFRYLFKILQHDFKCRFEVFKESHRMEVMFSSHLVQLFKEPRKQPLVKRLLYLIAASGVSTNQELELTEFRSSIQSLLEMRICVDLESAKRVNASPRKSRQELQSGTRILDLITEAVGYDKTMYTELLQVMEDSNCKTMIILNYFIKNAPKPLVWKMVEYPDRATVQDLLSCFKELTDARSIYKSIETDTIQVLLANAFKAGLRQTLSSGVSASTLEMCRLLRTAFENLQTICSDIDSIHPAMKQALIITEVMIARFD